MTGSVPFASLPSHPIRWNTVAKDANAFLRRIPGDRSRRRVVDDQDLSIYSTECTNFVEIGWFGVLQDVGDPMLQNQIMTTFCSEVFHQTSQSPRRIAFARVAPRNANGRALHFLWFRPLQSAPAVSPFEEQTVPEQW